MRVFRVTSQYCEPDSDGLIAMCSMHMWQYLDCVYSDIQKMGRCVRGEPCEKHENQISTCMEHSGKSNMSETNRININNYCVKLSDEIVCVDADGNPEWIKDMIEHTSNSSVFRQALSFRLDGKVVAIFYENVEAWWQNN